MTTTTLTSEPLASLLDRLFAEAEAPATPRMREALAALTPEERQRMSTSTERADYIGFYTLAKDAYLAVDRDTAKLLYLLVRSARPVNIVEFGTSFGISTLHMAAGLRDNSTTGAQIVATEFEPGKAATARENFATAGLDDLIDLREGDALETLGRDLPDRIDLVLFDGAKPLYPLVLDRLEPRLAEGALLLADNADNSPEYLARVRGAGYLSVPFAGDVELSLKL